MNVLQSLTYCWGRSLVFIWILHAVAGKFLWMEEEPKRDECTIIINGSKKGDMIDVHPPAHCRHGGYIHFANWGRVHMFIYVDLETKQEFELCLTSGLTQSTYIWYDFAWQHWEPISFPLWYAETPTKDMCRKSINGTIDLYLEPPWWYPNYVSYFSWTLTEIEDYQPKPWRRQDRWHVEQPTINVNELLPGDIKNKYKKEIQEEKDKKKKQKKKKKDNK